MNFPDSLYLHAFNLLPQFGPARLAKINSRFQNAQQAFEASQQQLIKAGIEPEIVKTFLEHKAKINLQQELENLQKENIKLLSIKDAEYPKLLLEISKPPILLYYKGHAPIEDELCIAVVGTRNITNYGRMVTPTLVEPLVTAGAIIVSGMAYGVDSAAHQIAVDKHKRTIAVLGGGLDEKSLYPQHHKFLAEKIIENGGILLSEYPIGTPNLKHHFVARNRIISGLSVGTVVIECDLQSGSLITAKYALEQNRQVFAVPGPIYSQASQGPNNLIKMGAKIITEAADILEDLNLNTLPEQQQAQNLIGDSKEETEILKLLGGEPVIINELVKLSGLDAAAVTSTLTFLEMKGKVRNLGGQQYVLSR